MSVARFEAVEKFFGKKKVLNRVNFSLETGEVVGLLGPNGSGKTTIMKLLSGMLSPNCGKIEVDKTFRALIETPNFYSSLSGLENLRYFAAYAGDSREHLEEIVDLLKMKSYIRKRVSAYSLGMRQKLGIAYTLLGSPRLLILDEPINGLDPLVVVEIRELLIALKQSGITILISSHILREMQEWCDRVLLLKEGNIIGDIPVMPRDGNIVVFLAADDRDVALRFLGQDCEATDDPLSCFIPANIPIHRAIKELSEKNLGIVEVKRAQTNLEELYCRVFREEL